MHPTTKRIFDRVGETNTNPDEDQKNRIQRIKAAAAAFAKELADCVDGPDSTFCMRLVEDLQMHAVQSIAHSPSRPVSTDG